MIESSFLNKKNRQCLFLALFWIFGTKLKIFYDILIIFCLRIVDVPKIKRLIQSECCYLYPKKENKAQK